MFDNFRGALKKRPKQEAQNGKVIKKKQGRPRKPNNTHLHLMMDETLKERYRSYASSISIDLSSLTSQLVRDYLNRVENNKSI